MIDFGLQDCVTFVPHYFAKDRSIFVTIYIEDTIKIS